jgi:hypothetical protein
MITIAVFSLVVFHPGFGFQGQFNNVEYEDMSKTESAGTSKEAVSLMVMEQHRGPA